MNKKELHELLDKTLEAIDSWMENIKYIKNANWDIETTIRIGIWKEIIKFQDKLKEYEKAVGEKE